jgi:hypothetical protein
MENQCREREMSWLRRCLDTVPHTWSLQVHGLATREGNLHELSAARTSRALFLEVSDGSWNDCQKHHATQFRPSARSTFHIILRQYPDGFG